MKNRKISLPGLDLTGSFSFESQILLVAGGRQPKPEWLQEAAKNRFLWGADRGCSAFLKAGILPHGGTGDFDSLAKSDLEQLKIAKVPLYFHPTDKDETDLELALKDAINHAGNNPAVWLSGCWGGRFDHLTGCMRTMEVLGKSALGLADEKEALIFLRGQEEIQVEFNRIPIAISLIPLSEKVTGIELSGVHWPLNGADWLWAQAPPISNRLAENSHSMKLSISQGLIGLYFCFEEPKMENE